MRERAPVTRALVALNVVGFIWEIVVTRGGILSILGGNNLRAIEPAVLAPILVLQGHQWYRLVSAAFVHGGLMHIFVNMISLWSLGRFIEYAVGSIRMTILYVTSMVAASLAVTYLSDPYTATLGASGAIFGLFGALFAIGIKLGKPGMDLVRSNIGILILNLVITFTPQFGISWQAHIGGLICGFILGLIVYTPPRRVQADVVDAVTGQQLETEYETPSPS